MSKNSEEAAKLPSTVKFDGKAENWEEFRLRVQSWIEFQIPDAEDLLSGDISVPDPPAVGMTESQTEKKERDRLRKASKSIYALLINSLTDLASVLDVPAGDGVALWNRLQSIYASTSQASIKQQLRTLIETKQAGRTVPEFVAEVFTLHKNLAHAVQLQKVDVVELLSSTILIEGLSDTYSVFKQQLFLEKPMSLQSLRQIIIEQTERINRQVPVDHGKQAHQVNGEKVCNHCIKEGRRGTNHIDSTCYFKHPHLRPASKTKGTSKKKDKHAKSVDALVASLKQVTKTLEGRASEGDNSSKQSGKSSDTHQAWAVTTQAKSVTYSSESAIEFEVDSACTEHFVTQATGLNNYRPASTTVYCANGSPSITQGVGEISGKLSEVLHAPDFTSNLLSVSKLFNEGKATLFHPTRGVLIANAADMAVNCNNPLIVGEYVNNVFKAKIRTVSPAVKVVTPTGMELTKTQQKAQLWLQRLGYPHPTRILEALKCKDHKIDLPVSTTIADFEHATNEVYQLARSKPKSRRSRGNKSTTAPFELLHFDIKYVEHPSYNKARYFALLVDDFSGWKAVLPMHHKYTLVEQIRTWIKQFVNSHGFRVRRVRCDNAGEQKSYQFNDFLTALEARVEYTSAHSSASNGVAERGIRTVWDTATTLLTNANFPTAAWAECAITAAFLENRLPSSRNDNKWSPYQMVYGQPPNLSILRTIGCKAYVHVPGQLRQACDAKARVGRLIGYSSVSRCYRILMNSQTGEIIESDSVTFNEELPNLKGHLSTNGGPNQLLYHHLDEVLHGVPYGLLTVQPSVSAHAPADQTPVLSDRPTQLPLHEDLHSLLSDDLLPHVEDGGRPQRAIVKPKRYQDKVTVNKVCVAAATKCNQAKIPYSEAVQDPAIAKAMIEEINHLYSIGAIKVVDLPPGRTPIGNTWAHKHKTDQHGNYLRTKSRLCPYGFAQIPGLDYHEDKVTSPTLQVDSAMLMLSLQVQRKQYGKLYDADSAFAGTANDIETYTKIPAGMRPMPGKALLLVHALNGTKQASRLWHDKADLLLRDLGFTPLYGEPCLYKRWDSDKLTIIGLFVDDFRIQTDDPTVFTTLEKQFKEKGFQMKSPDANHWLGLKLHHDREAGTLEVTQAQYIKEKLEEFGMTDCHPMSTPAAPGTKLLKFTGEMGEAETKFPMRQVVGALLWIGRTSRPDILYAVNQLCAHCNNYNQTHITAAKRVLRYLKGTMHLGITFRHNSVFRLGLYVDADFAGEPEGNDHPMRSLSGLIAYIHGVGPIYCSSSLQSTISKATSEAETRGTSKGAQVALGYRHVLHELGLTQDEPTVIFNDNQACIALTKNPYSGSRTRHIKVDHHYVRELLDSKDISVEYCPTADMIADILTKALPVKQFELLRDILLSGL